MHHGKMKAVVTGAEVLAVGASADLAAAEANITKGKLEGEKICGTATALPPLIHVWGAVRGRHLINFFLCFQAPLEVFEHILSISTSRSIQKCHQRPKLTNFISGQKVS
jgi:hypothetical protein